jgi:hypothetical protein
MLSGIRGLWSPEFEFPSEGVGDGGRVLGFGIPVDGSLL